MLSRLYHWIIAVCCLAYMVYGEEMEYHNHENNGSLFSMAKNGTAMKLGHSLSKGFAVFAACCFLLIIVVAVVCNIALIATIIDVRKLHTFTHVFIVNMAVNDLIIALGTVPFDVEFMLRGYFSHGKIACGIMHTTFLISLPASVLCLTLLTAERFISVMFPFQMTRLITKRKVVAAVIVTWSYTLAVALYPIANNKHAIIIMHGVCFLQFSIGYQIFQVVVNFLIPIVFICGVNATLLWVSHKHANKTARVVSQLDPVHDLPSDDKVDTNRSQKPRNKSGSCTVMASFRRNMKAAKRIALLVGVFLICWLSYIILVVTNYDCRCHPREVTWMGNVINYSSAAINPVLYGLMNKTIRHEISRKFRQFGKSCILRNQRKYYKRPSAKKRMKNSARESYLMNTVILSSTSVYGNTEISIAESNIEQNYH